MAITNVTTISTVRDSDTYSTHNVNSGTLCAFSDATFDCNDGVIVVGDDAASKGIQLSGADMVIIGDPDTPMPFIKNYKRGSSHYQNGINISGNLDISNCVIVSAGYIRPSSAAISQTYKDVYIKILPNTSNAFTLFYPVQGTLSIDGLIVNGGSSAFNNPTITQLKRYSPRNMEEGFLCKTGDKIPHWFEVENFEPQGCAKDFAWLAGGNDFRVVFYGYADAAPKAGLHYDHQNVTGYRLAEIRKELQINLTDSSGAPIAGAKSFFSKVVHDPVTYAESVFIGSSGDHIDTPVDYVQSETVAGRYDFDILCAAAGMSSSAGTVGKNSAPVTTAYYTKSNGFNYAFDVPFFKRGYQIKMIGDLSLTGLDRIKTHNDVLLIDANSGGDSDADVRAYTLIDTAQKFKDAADILLEDNYAGEQENLVNIVNGAATTVFDVVIDDQATDVIAFDGVTFTLKASNFSGDITTTGTIALLNNAKMSGIQDDANGRTGILEFAA